MLNVKMLLHELPPQRVVHFTHRQLLLRRPKQKQSRLMTHDSYSRNYPKLPWPLQNGFVVDDLLKTSAVPTP